ncbi:MAG: hypothetical protein MUD02_08270 [Bacteroidales bacterium]|nr:hypothetical protein [Bacteroidales bacterium]
MADGILFTLPDTDHELVLTAGIKGNTGLEGRYLASVSYSMISEMLFYTNLYNTDPLKPAMGNYFSVDAADVDLLNIHGEMSGRFSDKLTYAWNANYYNYSASGVIASYKPDWDARFELRYDLRSKIIAGAAFTATGSRTAMINADYASSLAGYPESTFELPAHFNLNLSAEYRYSKILSFWTRLNNIALKGYEEWAFYPTHRFQFMLGLTYSL